jgi:prepilin-type N-terminal cleavage/methylation domain-containing protein
MTHRFKYITSISRNRGFTLIEVLVASFIMFLVIASVTMVYRGAILSSGKAERTLLFSSKAESISEQIRIQIQSSNEQAEIQGQGSMGKVNYSWSATPIRVAKAPAQFNLALGEMDSGKTVFRLWNITLTLTLGLATRSYQFSEVSW